MTKTMAEVLAEHVPTASFGSFNMNGGGNSRYCSWGERFDVLYTELGDDENGTNPLLNHKLAAHQTAALSAAGFGLVADAKAEASLETAEDILTGVTAVCPGEFHAIGFVEGYRDACVDTIARATS